MDKEPPMIEAKICITDHEHNTYFHPDPRSTLHALISVLYGLAADGAAQVRTQRTIVMLSVSKGRPCNCKDARVVAM